MTTTPWLSQYKNLYKREGRRLSDPVAINTFLIVTHLRQRPGWEIAWSQSSDTVKEEILEDIAQQIRNAIQLAR
jgi:hypothetical protein